MLLKMFRSLERVVHESRPNTRAARAQMCGEPQLLPQHGEYLMYYYLGESLSTKNTCASILLLKLHFGILVCK